MKVPNYVCPACGRPFTRRSSTKRHIRTLHSGQGEPVTSMEYILGVNSGSFPPPSNIGHPDREQVSISFAQLLDGGDRWMYHASKLIERNVNGYLEGELKLVSFSISYYERTLWDAEKKSQYLDISKPKVRGFMGSVCEKCFAMSALEMYQDKGSRFLYPAPHRCKMDDILALPWLLPQYWNAVKGSYVHGKANSGSPSNRQLIMNSIRSNQLPKFLILVIEALQKKIGRKPFVYVEILETADFRDFNKADSSYMNANLQVLEIRFDQLPKEHIISRAMRTIDSKVRIADIASTKDLQEFFAVSQMKTFATFRILDRNLFGWICNIGIAFKVWTNGTEKYE